MQKVSFEVKKSSDPVETYRVIAYLGESGEDSKGIKCTKTDLYALYIALQQIFDGDNQN